MSIRHYILDAENHVVEAPLMEWAQWLENYSNCMVGWTQVTSQVRVSTIFLGLDHRWSGSGPPILFETMIFGGPLDRSMWRYASWDDAQAGHNAAVGKARAATKELTATQGRQVHDGES